MACSAADVSVGLLMPPPPAVPAGALALKLPPSLLGLRGLNNLGQTCFMNCILQIFVHCPPVARFFLSDRHNRLSCIHRRKQAQRTNDGSAVELRPCLACEMDTILAACYSGVQAPFSPHAFLHAMWCASEHFAGYEQQDAHEFLVAMLASIYSSMREPTAAAGPAPSQVEGSQRVRTPSLGGPSAGRSCQDLSSIFAGVLRSEVTCAKCRHRSVKREDFSDISLDLTRQYTAGRAGMEQVAGGDPAPAGLGKGGGLDGGGEASAVESLTACLRAFTGMEELSSDERCWCDKCGSLQNSSKQMSIERLPNVLCFQLKRFRQTMERGKHASKVDSFVEFPMHSLNMYNYTSAFISSRAASGGGSDAAGGSSRTSGGGGSDAGELSAVAEPRPPAAEHLYDLFGIALHHGTMQNGHYTAYIRRHASWFHCDDASVTPVTPKAVRSCKAYLLFYIRKAVC